MTRPRGMSERRRVFLGILGKRFPREGDIGLYTVRREFFKLTAEVEVTRVSGSGQTIWTRFTTHMGRIAFGGASLEHRWWRVPDDDPVVRRHVVGGMLYRAGGDSKRAPYGEISFPATLPGDAL